MLRILSRECRPGSLFVSVVEDTALIGHGYVYDYNGDPATVECVSCDHGTRCGHARIVRQAAEAVIAARTTDASMGVQS